jgi:cytochrome b subunit of formate dehydrogenase
VKDNVFNLPAPINRLALARRFVLAGACLLFYCTLTAGLKAQEVVCLDCHDTDLAVVADSVHGFLDCADCHAGAGSPSHPEGSPEVEVSLACDACHSEVVEQLETSIHGSAESSNPADALGARCASCHGEIHSLRPAVDPGSPIHPTRLAETCGACHANPDMAEQFEFHLTKPLEAYKQSVHSRAVINGQPGASCSSCHGSHEILPAADERSTVHHRQITGTCSQCHADIAEAYTASIHGQAAAQGMREAPVCTDCHGEHRILSPQEPNSPVYASNVAKMTCGRCHGDLRLGEKYGLSSDNVAAYDDSYHGLANRAGSTTVANCASCHGVHNILPSSDPNAHIHQDNLPETCGKCHPGAGERFAIGTVHLLPTSEQHTGVFYIRSIYLWLIVLTIGGMLLHNLLDFYRKLKLGVPRFELGEVEGPERMNRGFRIAHGLLASSFIVLAFTGFALKYPDAWWAAPLLSWESQFPLRSWIHRIAAVVMLGATLFHLIHLLVDHRARACIARMKPSRRDFVELKERILYFLGRRPSPPASEWVDYVEKLEYLAVVWGSMIMAVTGFALWFETFVLKWFPSWITDIATVVHFYEAILASLAIVVWHFYSVVFDPAVYPMDKAWLTGRSAPGRAISRRSPRVGPSNDRAQGEKTNA